MRDKISEEMARRLGTGMNDAYKRAENFTRKKKIYSSKSKTEALRKKKGGGTKTHKMGNRITNFSNPDDKGYNPDLE